MGNYILGGILLLILVVALVRAGKHFRGGGCCGSGSTVMRERKRPDGHVLSRKKMMIQGMHCKNCKIRVENALNRLDGVSCLRVRKKSAMVALEQMVPDEQLKEVVEKMGYQVLEIQDL